MTKELNRNEEDLQTVGRNSPFCDLRDHSLADSTTQAYASGINAAGDSKGTWTDTHEFLLSGSVCSQIDLARATGTMRNEGDPWIFRQEF